jgi:glucans biosynthesis protein
VDRRRFIAGSAAALSILGHPWSAGAALAQPAQPPADQPFDAHGVRRLARELAQKPFKAPDKSFPKELQDLSYDAYRAVRFRTERSLWRGEDLPFQVQFFHRGFIFTDRVDIYEVSGGRAKLFPIRPACSISARSSLRPRTSMSALPASACTRP